jgi:hypothetical protein
MSTRSSVLLLPRQREHHIEVGADDRRFGRAEGHLFEAVHLFEGALGDVFGHARFGDALAVVFHFREAVVAFAQFALDDFELLAQVVFALRVAKFLLHAVADALLEFDDLQLVAQQVYQRFEPLLDRHGLQHFLFVGEAQGREVRNRVGKASRLLHVRDGGDDFGRDAALVRGDFFEHFDRRAHQRFDVGGQFRLARGDWLHLCQQVRLIRF